MVRVSFGRTHHPTVWETIFCSGIIFRDLCGIFCSQDKGSRDIISCGMIPLIPGAALFMMMQNAFKADWEQFAQYRLEAFITGASIASGTIVAAVCWNIFKNYWFNKK